MIKAAIEAGRLPIRAWYYKGRVAGDPNIEDPAFWHVPSSPDTPGPPRFNWERGYVHRLVGGWKGAGYIAYRVKVTQEGIDALLAAWKPGVPMSASVPSPPEPVPVSSNECQDEATSASQHFPSLAMLGLKGWQQEAIWTVVSEHYNKRIPEPEELHAADLCRQVEKARTAKAAAKGDKPPQKHPSPDTCERFVAAYRAWYEKTHHH
jgi:hypothetical protein